VVFCCLCVLLSVLFGTRRMKQLLFDKWRDRARDLPRGLRGLALRAPRRAAWHLREAGRLAAVAHGVPERRRAAAPGGGRAAVVPVGRSEGLHGGAGDAVGPARSEASRASAPRAADRRRRRPIGGGCLGVARRGGAPRRCAVLRGITACADDCGRSALRLA
ncbi:unnamed protein product, partial [Prorocentrum cordatum]